MAEHATAPIDERQASSERGRKASNGKSPEAFRTISEAADELGLPQHVLRFWESKFPQIKPMKRGGGRRYYRPEDIVALRRIKDLLHVEGYTIKGAQKLLRDPAQRAALRDPQAPTRASESTDPPGEVASVEQTAPNNAAIDTAIERLSGLRDRLRAAVDN